MAQEDFFAANVLLHAQQRINNSLTYINKQLHLLTAKIVFQKNIKVKMIIISRILPKFVVTKNETLINGNINFKI